MTTPNRAPISQNAQLVQALSAVQEFRLHHILDREGNLQVAAVIDLAVIQEQTRISEHNLRDQIDRCPAQIAWWSRVEAQCDRVVQVVEARYAIFKSRQRIELQEKAKASGEKALTVAQLEDAYRQLPEYLEFNVLLEEVREARKSAAGVVLAFKAKSRLLCADLERQQDQSRRSI